LRFNSPTCFGSPLQPSSGRALVHRVKGQSPLITNSNTKIIIVSWLSVLFIRISLLILLFWAMTFCMFFHTEISYVVQYCQIARQVGRFFMHMYSVTDHICPKWQLHVLCWDEPLLGYTTDSCANIPRSLSFTQEYKGLNPIQKNTKPRQDNNISIQTMVYTSDEYRLLILFYYICYLILLYFIYLSHNTGL
jgi:hypothetical protein